MADLTSVDKLKLEKILEMETGFVLDFSDRTFQNFIIENTYLDIDEDKYRDGGNSKAKRLREFWAKESNYTVGKLTGAFLEHWMTQKLLRGIEVSPIENALLVECEQIARRLQSAGNSEKTDEVIIDVHFEKIQKQIVEQIQAANFTIWVAVAWFTDRVLYKQLSDKKQQGLNIQLIIVDDEINRKSQLPFEDEFETYRLKVTGQYENMMHNKFCVLDLKTVIHGSYNWTKKAQYNNEAISIEHSRVNAEKFAKQFLKLKRLSGRKI